MIHYAVTYAVGYFLSLYLQSVRGLGPRDAGLVLVVQPCFMAVLSPLAGRLSDRVEARWLASAGMVVTAAGLGVLLGLGAATPLALVIVALVLLGVGFALFSSPNTNAVMGSVEPRQYGVASATLGTMRLVGQMLSMGFAAMLLSVYLGGRAVTPDAHPAFLAAQRTAFLVAAGVCFAGVFASLARGRR
jgi:MFS family permease